jgi:hypothetical protein
MADNIEMRVARLEATMNHLKGEFMETLQDAYNRACVEHDAEGAAQFARLIRNKMLDATDKYDTVDRMFNFDLPDTISMTTIISAVTALIDGIKGIAKNEWSGYRQHLRDITDQQGFPFNIDWGTAPDAEETPED